MDSVYCETDGYDYGRLPLAGFEGGFIARALYILSQVRLWHWTTDNLDIHEILDELYTDIERLLDDLVEVYLVDTKSLSSGPTDITMERYEDIEQVEDGLSAMADVLELCSGAYSEDIDNILQELSQHFKKAIYKVRMCYNGEG